MEAGSWSAPSAAGPGDDGVASQKGRPAGREEKEGRKECRIGKKGRWRGTRSSELLISRLSSERTRSPIRWG